MYRENLMRPDSYRRAMIAEMDLLRAPPSSSERLLIDEIKSLDFSAIRRLPNHALSALGMEPQNCHNNVWRFLDGVQSKDLMLQAGWLKYSSIYYLHSVVYSDGVMLCVTPCDALDPLLFAPDSAIFWNKNGNTKRPVRRGIPVPHIVRESPERTILQAEAARAELLAGKKLQYIRMPE